MKRPAIVLILLLLAACHDLRRADSTPATRASGHAQQQLLLGEFDNHEQVWQARETAGAAQPPHVVIAIEAVPQADWSLWHVRLDENPGLDATWAMRRTAQADGTVALIPHRALIAAPAAASAFDAQQWTPLDACLLRGAVPAAASLRVTADTAACTAIAPGIGAQAALLPLGIEHDGDWLRVRLYSDQARGADAREDTRQVRWFAGWAAINGAGPKAAADSRDWHMDRGLRIGSEGGRFGLKWRDGSAAGYSLALERLTYRDGNVPVLKLSVVDDADGRTLAYAWANPEATRIGINLGWLQVGLDRDDVAASGTERKPAARNR